jgi:hypothetical protein
LRSVREKAVGHAGEILRARAKLNRHLELQMWREHKYRSIQGDHSVQSRLIAIGIWLPACLGTAVAAFWITLQLLDLWSDAPDRNVIHVTEATYGMNCVGFVVPAGKGQNRVRKGNATSKVSEACEEVQFSCGFAIDVVQLSDPANGCGKDFSVSWRCGSSGILHRAEVPGEADGKHVFLGCPEILPTNLGELPALPGESFSWLGIAGINARAAGGVPAVDKHPILRLIAVRDGVHMVAVRVSGLIKNESYRITAWIRPQGVANFGISARDQADKQDGPNKNLAIFDLARRDILSAEGKGKPGIRQRGDWLAVWTDLLTTDGQYIINFYICNRDERSYMANGRFEVILGGIGVD